MQRGQSMRRPAQRKLYCILSGISSVTGVPLQTDSGCGERRRRSLPDFLVALEQQAGGGDVPDRGDASPAIVMEASHEARIVGDRERIVDTPRLGQRLTDAHALAELPQPRDQPRTIADDIY